MGSTYAQITPELQHWIDQQHLFFVATAPLSADSYVNCSPKGMDSLRILDPLRVGYIDLTGSGAETIAHLRENGRVTIMFCAFEGAPKIVRLYGKGRFITPSSEEWPDYSPDFPDYTGARSIILVDITRIADSCGFGVPKYNYVESRTTLDDWAQKNSTDAVRQYQQDKNLLSIDGLPALDRD